MTTPVLAEEVPEPNQPAILLVRGEAVILDADLAARLGVETRTLNQAVKRNIERFPEGWAFQVTGSEYKALGLAAPKGRGGRRALPWVFTEHGVAKTRAEADQIEFATLVRKLRLVMGAELLMESGDVRAFLGVLDELSR